MTRSGQRCFITADASDSTMLTRGFAHAQILSDTTYRYYDATCKMGHIGLCNAFSIAEFCTNSMKNRSIVEQVPIAALMHISTFGWREAQLIDRVGTVTTPSAMTNAIAEAEGRGMATRSISRPRISTAPRFLILATSRHRELDELERPCSAMPSARLSWAAAYDLILELIG